MKTRGFLPRGRWTRGNWKNRFSTSGMTRACGPHGGPLVIIPCRVEDVVNLDVPVVLDVLHLLPVPVWLLEGLDDQGSGRGDNGNLNTETTYLDFRYSFHFPHLSLSVLDGELDGDLETFPVAGGLGDVLSDLLGRETEGTDLGGEGGRGSDLTTDHAELDDLDLIGVKLGRHLDRGS